MIGIMIDQIILLNVLSFLIWKISNVYDIAQRPPGTEKTITFSKKVYGDVSGVNKFPNNPLYTKFSVRNKTYIRQPLKRGIHQKIVHFFTL